jgi:hypothetical protein
MEVDQESEYHEFGVEIPARDKTEDISYVLAKIYKAWGYLKETFDVISRKRFSDYPEDMYDWEFLRSNADNVEKYSKWLRRFVFRPYEPQIEVRCL